MKKNDTPTLLSTQQESILLWLYRRQVIGMHDASLWIRTSIWGVPISGNGHTRAEQASISRAVRRLEARGLVLRQNEANGPLRRTATDPHTRTTNILVTPAGVKLAYETVNKKQKAEMLTASAQRGRA